MKSKKKYFVFLLFFYFFLLKELLEKYIDVVKYFDELIAFSAFAIFIVRLMKNNYKIKLTNNGYGRYIVLFLLPGVLGSVWYYYQHYIIAVSDFFLCIKFWLSIYVGKWLFTDFDLEEYSKKIYFHIRVVIVACVILVILDNLGDGIFLSTYRYGFRSTQLFYGHPTTFAANCVFVLAILIAVHPYVRGYMKYFVMLLLLMCTTWRSKAICAVLIYILIYYLAYIRKKKIKWYTFLLFIPAGILIAWDQIQFYFFSSIQNDSARYRLLKGAVEVANDHFPFGAGFGTFASYFSAVSYSPLYSRYHLSNVNGLRKGAADFVSDSFWPMILGQAGWLGLLCFVAAIIILFKQIQKIRNINISNYVSGLYLIIYLLIISMAEAAFVHPLAIPMALWIGFLTECKTINFKR